MTWRNDVWGYEMIQFDLYDFDDFCLFFPFFSLMECVEDEMREICYVFLVPIMISLLPFFFLNSV